MLPDTMLDRLRERYCEAHRHYHALSHVEHLLDLFRHHIDNMHNKESVEIAIWYHDAIYDVRSSRNEEDSAKLMRSELAGIVDEHLIEQATYMILCTAGHSLRPNSEAILTSDTSYFLDMDLSALGQDWDGYNQYRSGVRQEYSIYDDDTFNKGRLAFMETFLAKGRLYFTDVFHEMLEDQARQNLTRERDELRSWLSKNVRSAITQTNG